MYFICTREEEDYKELYGGSWGYYWNREDAVCAVHKNVTDMHETIYPYAKLVAEEALKRYDARHKRNGA